MKGHLNSWDTPTHQQRAKAPSAQYTGTQGTLAWLSRCLLTTTPPARPAPVRTASMTPPTRAKPRSRFPSLRTAGRSETYSRPAAAASGRKFNNDASPHPSGHPQPPWTLPGIAGALLRTSSTVAEGPRPEDTASLSRIREGVCDTRLAASQHERRRALLLHLIPDR